MSTFTQRLGLKKMGGGSSGTITPPDVVDVDDINTNMDRIDGALGAVRVLSTARPAGFDGQIIKETDTGDVRTFVQATGVWELLSGSPVGTISMWPTDTPPAGSLICNGAEISRATYAALFAVLGTTYGKGNDAGTTFNLPDFSGRAAVGVGQVKNKQVTAQSGISTVTSTLTMSGVTNLEYYNGQGVRVSSSGVLPGGLSAGTTYYLGVQSPGVVRFYTSRANVRTGTHIPLTSQGSGNLTVELLDDFAPSLGRPYGTSAYQLRPGELPAHGHGARWINQNQNDGSGNRWAAASGVGYSDGADGFIGATGSDSTHGNLQPSLGINYIIRAVA